MTIKDTIINKEDKLPLKNLSQNNTLITYIINLPSSTKRREAIKQQVSKEKLLEVVFVNAVKGSDLSYERSVELGYDREKRKLHRNDLELNEIACFLSHRKTLDIFLEGEEEYCIILEDDAELRDGFADVILQLLEFSSGWDLINLDTRTNTIHGFSIKTLYGSRTLYVPLKVGLGATALLYSRSGAKKLRKSMNNFQFAFDTHIGFSHWKHRMVVAQIFPSIVSESKHIGASTIGCRNVDRQLRGLLPLLRRKYQRILHSIMKRIYTFQTRKKISFSDQVKTKNNKITHL